MLKKITCITTLFVTLFSMAQTVSTVSAGNFYDSIGMDSQGSIYCSDYFGDSVFKYDTNGNVTTFKSGFTNPNGITVNEQDEIFVCDAGANIVYKYNTSGTLLSSFTTNINNPTGIKNIPGSTNLYIVEYSNNTLKMLEQDGTITTLFTGFPLNGPSGIAIINGETYISNFNDRKIMHFENGNMTLITQLPASGPNNNFIGFLAASNNKLYATQWGAQKIYSIDPTTGDAIIYAGSTLGNTNGDISVAQFNFPNGIFADTVNDRIYVSDAGTSNLRIIDNAQLSIGDFANTDTNLKVISNRQMDSINVSANLSSNKDVSIQIFEITGKEVFSENFENLSSSFRAQIEVEQLNSGVYIFLFSQEGNIISRKIII